VYLSVTILRVVSPKAVIFKCDDIVAYLPKARTVEPKKQPLLANGSEITFLLGKGSETNNGTSVARRKILNEQK
jgi:hypothetical protein